MIHTMYSPFKYSRLNLLESICLLCLISINVSINSLNSNNVFVSFCILLPFLIFFYYLAKMIHFIIKTKYLKDADSFTTKDIDKIEKIKSRLPAIFEINTASKPDSDNNKAKSIEHNSNNDDTFDDKVVTEIHTLEKGENKYCEESMSGSIVFVDDDDDDYNVNIDIQH